VTSGESPAIRTGLIGYGYWGPNLARNLAEHDGVELTAIADPRPERRALAARRYPWLRPWAEAAALLDREDLDAIVIATPLATHYALARAAIERGKHVLVEKPLAGTRAEAEELAALADARGVRLMVDHTFVYNGAVRKIRAIVNAGELGDLLYLDSVRVNLGLFQQDTNVIWDLAAHDVAILDYLIGERPQAVSANGSALAGFKHENIAYIAVHYASGFLAHFHVNWLAPVKLRQMLVGGRQRMLLYDDMDPGEKVRVYDKGVDINVQDEEARRQIFVSYRTGDMNAPRVDRREALSLVVEEFVAAIAERRAPLTGGAAGVRVVSVLEAAERSLRSGGQRVTL
jgi:predicted dehydrogenase